MSVARTARRRRKQASQGHRGLEQIFGKRRCPHYPGAVSKERSAKALQRLNNMLKTKGR